MQLLVGLGNPGPSYARNRHNIGFLAVGEIARRHSFQSWRKRFHGLLAEGQLAGERLLTFKPQTFMNRSGGPVGEAFRFFKMEPKQVIVFHDDIDLEPGRVRIKCGGGHGGHNGLRSIDKHIGKDYWRVRLGVGHPGDKEKVTGHVLHDFAKTDDAWTQDLLAAIAGELPRLIIGDPPSFMSRVAQSDE